MGKFIDLTNQRFGFWVVKKLEKRASKSNKTKTQWLCVCDCGTERIVTSNSLRSGNSTSCGCNHVPNLSGFKIGRFEVLNLSKDKDSKSGRRYWDCKCECGRITILSTYQLRNNKYNFCECDLLDSESKLESKVDLLSNKENAVDKLKAICNKITKELVSITENQFNILFQNNKN